MPEPCGNLTLAETCRRYPVFAPALQAVADLDAGALVAVDGRCGSGKTTLGALLAAVFGCAVVHTDDYYLPFARRAPGWEHTPAANMDLARLRAEVLDPLRAGRAAVSRPYDCHRGQFGPAAALPAGALTVLEGSYAHHPALGPYTLRVFLTCEPAVQAARLQAREGGNFEMFRTRWVPLEEGYLQAYGVEAAADLVLHTDASGG